MAAPSKDYADIADTQVDADSPLDTVLMTSIRDNLVHLKEVLYDTYTPAKPHTHDGVNSAFITSVADGVITPAKMSGYAPGDVLLASADTLVSFDQTYSNYTRVKEIRLARGGALRIKFDLRDAGYGLPAYGRIYRNGVAVGAERSTTLSAFTTYSEDVSGWTGGDLCQLYVKTPGGTELGEARNFRVYVQYTHNNQVLMD